MKIKKLDEVLQIAYGEVYTPGMIDSQGDYMSEESVRSMAHRFLESLPERHVDVGHSNDPVDAGVVESFVARKSDPDFIPGSWVVGVHIRDGATWEKVTKGELNGFSLQGPAIGHTTMLEVEVPEFVDGVTTMSAGHSHRFRVHFDDSGTFLGGSTDEVDGHRHVISKGTATEQSEGHSHRFSFVEGFLDV